MVGIMGPMLGAAFVAGCIAFIRVSMYYMDKSRIMSAAWDKGWTDVAVRWSPFAPGAFFGGSGRHYYVTYVDESGRSRGRYCKTSFLTGIYWRDEDS